jgi:hypothetical protein
VVCLRNQGRAQADPQHILDVAGYHCHWHGHPGYSGVALLLREKTFGDAPSFIHPPFDMETRIVVAEVGSLVIGSVYGPNGGKDYAAKIEFWKQMVMWAAELREAGKHLVLSGDFNIARLEIDVHPALRKPMIGRASRSARCSSSSCHTGCATHRRDPENDRLFTVGTVAQPAPAQHGLAARLHRREHGARRRDGALRRVPGLRNERSRPGDRHRAIPATAVVSREHSIARGDRARDDLPVSGAPHLHFCTCTSDSHCTCELRPAPTRVTLHHDGQHLTNLDQHSLALVVSSSATWYRTMSEMGVASVTRPARARASAVLIRKCK